MPALHHRFTLRHPSMSRHACQAVLLFATLATSAAVHASSGTWDVSLTPDNGFGARTDSWATNASGALYAEWNWFTDDLAAAGIQDTTPDVGSSGVSLAHTYETSGAAFLTGGGNIYSFSAPTAFTAVLADAAATAGTRTLALRVSTMGNLPLPTATLNGVAAQAVEVFSASSGSSFGGNEKEYLWLWAGISATPNYTFKFGAAESSMSLDQLAVYASPVSAAPVPEPGSLALLIAGLGGVALASRRKGLAR